MLRAKTLFLALAPLLALLVVSGCGATPQDELPQAIVIASVSPVSSAHPLQQGTQATLVIPTFYGQLSTANSIVVFTQGGNQAGSASITNAQETGGTYPGKVTVTFTIPQLPFSTPTDFDLSVNGITTRNGGISTSSPIGVTIYPPATITSITPAVIHAGLSATIAIQAANANFAQGVTTANFGPGISVGGAASGTAGPVAVNGPDSATASIAADPTAAPGARTLSIATTDQAATTSNSFSVGAELLQPAANPNGPYSGFATQAIAFSSQGSSDPNGLSLIYAWDFGDNSTSPQANPSHTYAKPGTYTVKLTVSDSAGASNTVATTANVSALSPPVPSTGGPYTGTTGQAITFNASASADPNNSALTYTWDFGDGSQGSGATSSHTYSKAGTYTVALKLTDTYNQTATATTTASITNAAKSPVSNPGGPYSGFSGVAIAFTGSASSDPNGLALTYAWDFGDSSQGTGVSPSHTYSKAGTYTVALTVSDSSGLSTTANTTATITALSVPMPSTGGPYSGTTGQSITFNAGASTDPNKSPFAYAWNFGDGSQANGVSVSHTYAKAGTYTVTLTLTDGYNQTASGTTTATISAPAQPPVANPGGLYTGVPGQTISFNGGGSTDPNGLTLTYVWDFGDGTQGSGATPSHAYLKTGTYTVNLTVSDSSGLSGSASTTATITAPTVLTAIPGGPYSGVAGNPIQLSGAASFDPKNEILSYAWDFGDRTQGTGVSPSHTYTQAGIFTVMLTVTNTDNVTATATTTATISAALAAVLNGPYSGNVSQVLSFNGQSSTAPSGDTLTYAWDFGDSSTSYGSPVTHAYDKAGTFPVTLTVTDTATSKTASSTSTATITQPLAVSINTPSQGALFNTTTIGVTGVISEPGATASANGVSANVSGSSFTVSNLPVREGVNLITVTAADAQGHSGTASTSITVDMTPPAVSVSQPLNASTVTTQQINVTGMVTDIVTGTVNSNDVTVTINGQAATVSNRSFELPGFLLIPGLNTLSVVATDKAGNSSTTTVNVMLASTAAQQHILLLSGDQQTGVIDSVLPQPLVAQLVSANGTPIPNRAVTFTVSASDGLVKTCRNRRRRSVS